MAHFQQQQVVVAKMEPAYVDFGFLEDDEGYGSTESSPEWTNTTTFFESNDAMLQYSSLFNSSIWGPKEPNTSTISVVNNTAKHGSPNVLPRDYSHIEKSRPVVTVDVELVESNDEAHHPFDRQMNFEANSLEEDRKHTLRKPWGVAVNSRSEQIYVADRQYHVILVFGPDGEFQFQFGEQGKGEGQFHRPTGIAFDNAGDRLFVVDKDNHRIQAFDATGNYLFQFGSRGKRAGQLFYPWGIAVSRDGLHVAVSDARNHRIQLFSSNGDYIRQFTAYSTRSDEYKTVFNYPRGLVFDPTGQFIYVTDFNLHCVFRLDIQFTHLEKIVNERELSRPSGIDVDAEGNIVVSDHRHHSIKVFRPDGHRLLEIRRLRDSHFDLSLDLAVMPAGFIAALDLNGRIRVF